MSPGNDGDGDKRKVGKASKDVRGRMNDGVVSRPAAFAWTASTLHMLHLQPQFRIQL